MTKEPTPLKLQARDDDDLAVISSLLQDALVPLGDIEFLTDAGIFVMAANRYRWEADDPALAGERTLCGVAFANVTGVQRRNLAPLDRGTFYNLLSVERDDGSANMAVTLTFSNEAAIRLRVSALSCSLEDFGEAWPAGWRPQHD